MSDQTTRPAPAALSAARLAELTARYAESAAFFRGLSKAKDVPAAGRRVHRQMADDHDAIVAAVAELSRLRAGLTQAPELIKRLREPGEIKSGHLCRQAADLLSALLPQDDTTKERT